MKLTFTEREVFGKKVATLRKEGVLPVVCYGNKEKVQPYSIATKQFKKMLDSDEVLISGDGVLLGKSIVLQSVEYHPVTEEPLHADFLFVDVTHEIEHDVPVHVVGEAPGVKVAGGELIIVQNEVTVRALPQHIPGHLDIDVSGLAEIGSHLVISEIPLPEGVALVNSPKDIVISIVAATEEEEEKAVEAIDMDAIEVAGKGKKEVDENESDDA